MIPKTGSHAGKLMFSKASILPASNSGLFTRAVLAASRTLADWYLQSPILKCMPTTAKSEPECYRTRLSRDWKLGPYG